MSTRQSFYFDATGAFVSAVSPGAELHNILSELGVIDELTFLPINAIWNIYPDFDLRLNYQDPKLVYERDPDKPAFRMKETPGFLKLVQKNNRTGPRSSFRTARAGAIPLPT